MTARERRWVAALVADAVRPVAPLPPVDRTDAVEAFGAWLCAAPAPHRLAVRALLAATTLAPRRLAGSRALLRRLAAQAYYGDPAVMRQLGYDAQAVVRRAAETRANPQPPSQKGQTPSGGLGSASSIGAGTTRGGASRPNPQPPSQKGQTPSGVVRGSGIAGRRRMRADAVVVGTGAGGAVVAKELAEGGMSVVMLEEGEWLDPSAFSARPRDEAPRHFRDGAMVATVGNVPIVVPLGRAVGGTTILNSATCYRTPPALLDAWGLWTADELEPCFRRVERTFGVGRVPRSLAGRNAHVMERGARALGWSGEYLHRAARGCIGSGVCAFGCPSNGKQHTGNTYVPLAHEAGAITVTGARATRVLPRGGVLARTSGGGRLRVDAGLVVVACGTIQTPLLLRRSGIRAAGLGENLSLHPATGVFAELDEDVDMLRGVPQAFAVDEFARDGLMLEGWAGSPDMLALSLPLTGEEHRDVMLRYRRIAHAGLMIRDRSRGRVIAVGDRAVIRYDVGRADAELLVRGIARAAELELAAGARRVHVPIDGSAPVETRAQARTLRARARDLGLTAFHPLGTAAAGTVVDRDLRLRDDVLVADGSVVPSALGVNPQLTIMALATRAAFAVLGRRAPEDEPAPASLGRAPAAVAA